MGMGWRVVRTVYDNTMVVQIFLWHNCGLIKCSRGVTGDQRTDAEAPSADIVNKWYAVVLGVPKNAAQRILLVYE
jgi:hypothetical protein